MAENTAKEKLAIEGRIRKKVPQIIKIAKSKTPVVMFHQDAFGYQITDDELLLMGLVIKYLGFYGKEVRIIGTNKETDGNI